MALAAISNGEVSKSSMKDQFETRLRLLKEKATGIKKREMNGYTLWRMFTEVLVVRAYREYYTLHTNGDFDHYEVKRVYYKDIKYDCNDFQFFANLLETEE